MKCLHVAYSSKDCFPKTLKIKAPDYLHGEMISRIRVIFAFFSAWLDPLVCKVNRRGRTWYISKAESAFWQQPCSAGQRDGASGQNTPTGISKPSVKAKEAGAKASQACIAKCQRLEPECQRGK